MRADRRHLLQRLAFSELRHFSWDNFPTNTIAYDSAGILQMVDAIAGKVISSMVIVLALKVHCDT